MAPKKSKVDRDDKGKKPVATSSSRVTRSMVRRTRSENRGTGSDTSGSASKHVKLESPKKTKKKKATSEAGSSKRIKKEEEAPVVIKKEKESDEDVDAGNSNGKTIIVEYCKQCSSFKKRANEVKDGLEKAVPGITVTLNPDNPRRGCFEIREMDGETFISLLNMKRPFTPMKKLEMEKVIQDIVEKIN